MLHSCEHRLPGRAVTVQGLTKMDIVSFIISKIGDCILYQVGQPHGLAIQCGTRMMPGTQKCSEVEVHLGRGTVRQRCNEAEGQTTFSGRRCW